MKLKFISILFLIPFLTYSQLITTDIFTVQYDQEKEQPVWVEYTVQCPRGYSFKIKEWIFIQKSNIHTSDNEDYYK